MMIISDGNVNTRDVNGMGQLGMGPIPSHPTGMGWDWDSKIIIFMGWDGTGPWFLGWDGTGTTICGTAGWDKNGIFLGFFVPRDLFVPRKYYFQKD